MTPERQGWFKQRDMDSLWEVIEIEEITLDTSGPEHEIIILFRDLARPRCLFGYRVEAVESFGDDSPPMEPEIYATIIYANLSERILAVGHGLPKDCSPDGVNWF